jgi:putative transcription factor
MCGAEAPVALVEIDHVELYACPKCARFGKSVVKKRTQKKIKNYAPVSRPSSKPRPRGFSPPKKDFLHDKILKDGYGQLIQDARREKGLGRAEFAKMIKEKETLLARIEAEKVLPTDRVVAKIERELNVELKTEMSDEGSVLEDFIPRSTTIGSIAKIKRKKK